MTIIRKKLNKLKYFKRAKTFFKLYYVQKLAVYIFIEYFKTTVNVIEL